MTRGGAETENASLPEVTLTVGSPNRFASAGARMKGPFRPVCTSVIEPSECMVAFPGPGVFSVMVFAVCRFVNEVSAAPVKRKVLAPSAVLRTLEGYAKPPAITNGLIVVRNP
jgi:hypothetical protein